MCSRGVWQLRHVNIQYSETGHSSRGIRFYFRQLLPKWRERNSEIKVTTSHQQFEEPVASFQYIKEKHDISLKDLNPRQIEEVLNLARNSESSNQYLRHGGPKVWTEKRSIQGLWQPSLQGQVKALGWFHRKRPPLRLPKYSAESLELSIQAIRGEGRWGSEREFPKGWDQMHLKDILGNPLIKP
ncbi:putative ribosomal protein l22/l43 [Cardiosporidium cionae]|uniref:Large ribosomal subunit protein mL43 n=1 Tax=Cardiosporidium cionae TaxID=476202 RepID=A0ABQ7J9A7_9APIC|nr:putative ribosomal protein l22/l43 [Cardiosporidium cionae]|eukprot:KAF8820534.1 putative ribosomal protein l22/l43 [Cardiosporidium cionae]